MPFVSSLAGASPNHGHAADNQDGWRIGSVEDSPPQVIPRLKLEGLFLTPIDDHTFAASNLQAVDLKAGGGEMALHIIESRIIHHALE